MAKVKVREVVAKVSVDAKGFRAGLQRAGDQLNTFRAKAVSGFAAVSKSLGGVQAALAAIGAGAGLKVLISQAATLKNTADNIGVTAESLQRLRFAADQSGASAAQMDDAVRRLNRRIGEFVDGGGPGKAVFDKIGFSAYDAAGNIKTADNAILEIADAVAAADSSAEKARIAVGAFGEDAGPKLVKLLSQGSEAIKDLGNQADIVSEETAAAAVKIEDQYNRLVDSITANLTELAVTVASVFADLRSNQEKLNDLLKEQAALEEALSNSRVRGRPARVARLEEIKKEVELLQKRVNIEKSSGATPLASRVTATAVQSQAELSGDRRFATPEQALAAKDQYKISNLIEGTNKDLKDFKVEATLVSRVAQDMEGAFETAFSSIAAGAQSLKGTLSSLAQSLAGSVLKQALIQPLAGAITGAIGGATTSGGAGIGSLAFSGLQGFANGGSVMGNRPIVVGERGPELFIPNTSGMIKTNGSLNQMAGGGGQTINIDARGAAPGVEQQIRRVMMDVQNLRGQVPQMAIASVQDAGKRGVRFKGGV